MKRGRSKLPYATWDQFRRDIPFFIMLIIPIGYFLIFKYWPLFGLAMAFQDYKLGDPFISASSNWVGFKQFKLIFGNPMFGRWVRNTLGISLWSLVFGFPTGIFLALLFNEIQNGKIKGFASNISLLPHFISTVVIVGMLRNLFSIDGGIVNNILVKLGMNAIDFQSKAGWFRPLYTFSGIWQGAGFSAIVYTAAISGVDQEMYEAAKVDGCTRLKAIRHITLPSIAPTVVTLFLLKIGGLMSVGYEKIILMYQPSIYSVADTLSTYSYRAGIENSRYSLSTAIGLFDGVVNLILLISANKISKKVSSLSLW